MKKNFLLLALLSLILSSFSSINAQENNLLQEDSKWNILRQIFNTNTQKNDKRTEILLVKKDTSINNIIYKNLYQKFKQADEYKLIGQIRGNFSDKIYFRPINHNEDFLLYDFSLKVGETTKVLWANNTKKELTLIKIRVDSIVSIKFNKQNRLKYYISSKSQIEDKWSSNNEWIEGIGSIEGILYSTRNVDVGGVEAKQLLCYSISDNLLFKNKNYNSCYIDNMKSIELQNDKNIISYDNLTKQLLIKTQDAPAINLIIFDSIGRVVFTKAINESQSNIALNFLSNGLYIINIWDKNSNKNSKLKILKR